MAYPHEAEIARWLENLSRWSPSTGVGGGGSMWSAAVRTSAYHSAPIPVLGGEAGDTQAALERMDRRERAALEQYHLRPGTMARKARRLRCSVKTLERRLHDAHHHLYEIRWGVRHQAQQSGKGNVAKVAEGGRMGKRRGEPAQLQLQPVPKKPSGDGAR